MKAIIDGRRYDTETATEIGGAGNVSLVGRGDFRHWSATLYRTKRSGRYFLAGYGGAMSRFAAPYGNNGSQSGSGIQPMTRDEAREWAERHLSTAEVEAAFADVIEDA